MLLIVPRPRRDKKIHTDDGLNLRVFAFLIKLNRAVEIAVVGKRKRDLPVLFCRFYELRQLRQRFKKRIMTVCMKVYKSTYISGSVQTCPVANTKCCGTGMDEAAHAHGNDYIALIPFYIFLLRPSF